MHFFAQKVGIYHNLLHKTYYCMSGNVAVSTIPHWKSQTRETPATRSVSDLHTV